MEKLLQLLSSYNFLNNLMPGAVFYHALTFFCGIEITFTNYIDYLFLYYFLGLVISRVGSVVIKPIMKKFKLIEEAPYEQFVMISKDDKKLDMLSEINNVYRTFLAGCILLAFVSFYKFLSDIWPTITYASAPAAIILLILLFGFSFRKQTKTISERIDAQQKKRNDIGKP